MSRNALGMYANALGDFNGFLREQKLEPLREAQRGLVMRELRTKAPEVWDQRAFEEAVLKYRPDLRRPTVEAFLHSSGRNYDVSVV